MSHITWLRQQFSYEGTIVEKETSKRGCDVGSKNNKSTKVNEEAIKAIASYIDLIHSQGGSVNSTIINGMLCDKFAFDVH